jgi:hypothetical protein
MDSNLSQFLLKTPPKIVIRKTSRMVFAFLKHIRAVGGVDGFLEGLQLENIYSFFCLVYQCLSLPYSVVQKLHVLKLVQFS